MKKINWNIIILITIITTTSTIVYSQDQSSHESTALTLLNMMNMEKTLSQGVDVSLSAQLKANPSLIQYEDIMRSFLAKYMSWSNLKEKFVKLYCTEFSESELQAMIDFYKTDVGKKVIEKLPILMSKGGELGQQAVQEHVNELTEAIKKRSSELNKN